MGTLLYEANGHDLAFSYHQKCDGDHNWLHCLFSKKYNCLSLNLGCNVSSYAINLFHACSMVHD